MVGAPDLSAEIQQMVLETPAQLSDDQSWCGTSLCGAMGLKPFFLGGLGGAMDGSITCVKVYGYEHWI